MSNKFIFIHFIPGAAGNFISRCLNLLTGVVAWADRKQGIPTTLDEKFKLFSYQSVLNFDHHLGQSWIDFEHRLLEYYIKVKHNDIPPGAVGVFLSHPRDPVWCDSLLGKDDQRFVFYIDPSDCYEWCIMNAYWKNSFHSELWFCEGKTMLQNPEVHKINLQKIISSYDSFIEEFAKLCRIIDHPVTPDELDVIKILYFQWKTTQLNYPELIEFKQHVTKKLIKKYFDE